MSGRVSVRACERCGTGQPRGGRAKLCDECLGPKVVNQLAARRRETLERQRRLANQGLGRGRRARDPRAQHAREHATVPLELLAARGDMMTIAEIAAVLGLSVNGVKLIERCALEKVRQALREAVA